MSKRIKKKWIKYPYEAKNKKGKKFLGNLFIQRKPLRNDLYKIYYMDRFKSRFITLLRLKDLPADIKNNVNQPKVVI